MHYAWRANGCHDYYVMFHVLRIHCVVRAEQIIYVLGFLLCYMGYFVKADVILRNIGIID